MGTSSKLKIATIVGARPQFIKSAAISQLLKMSSSVEEVLIHTGQHYDYQMSEIFFKELGLQMPKISLSVESGSQVQQISTIISALEEPIAAVSPDLVLVYGDTNSTLAGALVASKLQIPIAHVEAGLRHGNRKRTEETNRIVTDHLSDFLFLPHEKAYSCVMKEGLSDRHCVVVGDVMYDVALSVADKVKDKTQLLTKMGVRPGEFALCSLHRAENTDDPERLSILFDFLYKIAKDIPIVLPLHPRTRKKCLEFGISLEAKQLHIIDPIGYLDMISLETKSKFILTDSGGVQREAYFFKKPCITLRDETEWTELIDVGWNFLCPITDSQKLLDMVARLTETNFDKLSWPTLFGDGASGEKIISYLEEHAVRKNNQRL